MEIFHLDLLPDPGVTTSGQNSGRDRHFVCYYVIYKIVTVLTRGLHQANNIHPGYIYLFALGFVMKPSVLSDPDREKEKTCKHARPLLKVSICLSYK